MDDSEWGSLRGVGSSKPVPPVENTELAGRNNETSHLTASAAALLAKTSEQRIRAIRSHRWVLQTQLVEPLLDTPYLSQQDHGEHADADRDDQRSDND